MKKKIMLIFGTRPEAIKMAPLYKKLKLSKDFKLTTCITAQHRYLLDQVLEVFAIKPDIDFNIMSKNQNLFDVTTKVLLSMKNLLFKKKPNLVLVHGDTTTTLAAALSAFYMKIDICHIEAGLRTYNINSPFPEEFNRQAVSKIASWHFSPTKLNKKNLISEGVEASRIFVTGNTAIDSLKMTIMRISKIKRLKNKVKLKLSKVLPFQYEKKKFILITAHRRENFGKNLYNIFYAIKKLAFNFPQLYFVYIIHPNPNIKKNISKILSKINNVYLINPLQYQEFCFLMNKCYLVMTDSGGIQEEAPSLGKPVIVLRENTERPEAVKSGTAILVGNSIENIYETTKSLIINKSKYNKMVKKKNPYGNGLAADKIINYLKKI
jgi:UDP-N-acetylglucosamine 2-epimerase (non-hydrolysing)